MKKVETLRKKTFVYLIDPRTKRALAAEWHDAGENYVKKGGYVDVFDNRWVYLEIGGYLYEADAGDL